MKPVLEKHVTARFLRMFYVSPKQYLHRMLWSPVAYSPWKLFNENILSNILSLTTVLSESIFKLELFGREKTSMLWLQWYKLLLCYGDKEKRNYFERGNRSRIQKVLHCQHCSILFKKFLKKKVEKIEKNETWKGKAT